MHEPNTKEQPLADVCASGAWGVVKAPLRTPIEKEYAVVAFRFVTRSLPVKSVLDRSVSRLRIATVGFPSSETSADSQHMTSTTPAFEPRAHSVAASCVTSPTSGPCVISGGAKQRAMHSPAAGAFSKSETTCSKTMASGARFGPAYRFGQERAFQSAIATGARSIPSSISVAFRWVFSSSRRASAGCGNVMLRVRRACWSKPGV
jgi:hypothetical protein